MSLVNKCKNEFLELGIENKNRYSQVFDTHKIEEQFFSYL